MNDRWPGDSREDRARRVALSYRALAYNILRGNYIDPLASLKTLDDNWIESGQTWIRPTDQPLRLDDWLTNIDMSELFHISAKSIYDWGRRGHIRIAIIDGEKRYNVGDLVTYERGRRIRRIG